VCCGVNSKSYPAQFAWIAAQPNGQRAAAVADFYEKEFWTPLMLGGLESQDVATRVLDMAVNGGPQTAIRLLQMAINALGHDIVEDGHNGPNTLSAANSCDPESLLASFRAQRVIRYNHIFAAKDNPTEQDADNLKVWLKRAVK
jgi:lysozyme family protein